MLGRSLSRVYKFIFIRHHIYLFVFIFIHLLRQIFLLSVKETVAWDGVFLTTVTPDMQRKKEIFLLWIKNERNGEGHLAY
jgi:hypothetical protein